MGSEMCIRDRIIGLIALVVVAALTTVGIKLDTKYAEINKNVIK